jgi:predicted dehydrogenase
MSLQIGMVGLGRMGANMARRLARGGAEVVGFDSNADARAALAHTLFIRSLRALSAHTASVVAALEPVYGIALALLLLGEMPPVRTLAGAVLIIGAALYATRTRYTHDVRSPG